MGRAGDESSSQQELEALQGHVAAPVSCPVRKLFANPSARLQESVDARREWMQSAHIAQRAGNLFAPERVVGQAGDVKNEKYEEGYANGVHSVAQMSSKHVRDTKVKDRVLSARGTILEVSVFNFGLPQLEFLHCS